MPYFGLYDLFEIVIYFSLFGADVFDELLEA
jgi:hypothetical protein